MKFALNLLFSNNFQKSFKENFRSTQSCLTNLEDEAKEEQTIDEKLLKYKEFKYLYNKTRIKPKYILILLMICLMILVIGYLENLITCTIGVLYPLYFSIKSLREKNENYMKSWLQYWIIFAFFLNLESVFAYFFNEVPLYFFYKVVFLLICFLPPYNGAEYFYINLIKPMFQKYEKKVYIYSKTIAEKIKSKLMDSEIENGSETCSSHSDN